jgi:preprotein translocase subunit SecY
MWLAEKIQDKGLGNGTSIIIMVGILSRLPNLSCRNLTRSRAKGAAAVC